MNATTTTADAAAEPTKNHMARVIVTALYHPKAAQLVAADDGRVQRIARRNRTGLIWPYNNALAVLAQQAAR